MRIVLKMSCNTPIAKLSNSNRAPDLRPINMLPKIEKILEKKCL